MSIKVFQNFPLENWMLCKVKIYSLECTKKEQTSFGRKKPDVHIVLNTNRNNASPSFILSTNKHVKTKVRRLIKLKEVRLIKQHVNIAAHVNKAEH